MEMTTKLKGSMTKVIIIVIIITVQIIKYQSAEKFGVTEKLLRNWWKANVSLPLSCLSN